MKYIYCGRSEFLKAVKRNCVNHFVQIYDCSNEMLWFATQKAFWCYRYEDVKDIMQFKIMTQDLNLSYCVMKVAEI